MARRNTHKGTKVNVAVSARRDCTEKQYLMLGHSLMMSPNFQILPAGTRVCYLAMCFEAKGKIRFQFPQGVALKYGISSSSLRRHIDELCAAGFIRIAASGRTTREANDYEFMWNWKPAE